ncbi:flagellar basal-body MS-ring/collar protein FliF [Thalassovita taeanensis]|uniref:Flagellar M-ring protein n=1 Tax=Thalassovita taeanensis TaxID=657014 RepID=A0A1H9CJM3_9RHOB|nr:flagellar basal-body MS-ring/collar protein FliF [Thalassovita taeanensis]SEQ01426.1 flagellar M-ring protein FliF [Thalassovita taeanensis]
MKQIVQLWSALDPRKRVFVILATVAVFAAVLALSRQAATPSMSLLYAGLESGAAGDVVQSLEQRGVRYSIRGGSIFVESAQRDELRMTLASEGLPTNGNSGYELLDNLSGFGTTSQMFDAAYWRAKEGELARTIVASPHITQARVHIANSGSNPFQREVRPTASVSVTTVGGGLSPNQARALRFLIASAVTGLRPNDVAVIDGSGGLISADEVASPATGEDRNDTLRDRVQRILEARVGRGNAVVELSVETVTESESIVERRFDPTGRVVVSSDTEESTNNSKNGAGGDVTVASNIPAGDAAGNESASAQNSQSRERVNYEVSETQREVVRAPGAVKRVTVAVLVNGVLTTTEDGAQSLQPRPSEELEALRELVASTVGFDEDRGDVITLKSMSFEPILPQGTEASSSMLTMPALDLMSIIQMAVLALVALILGLFVIRPLLSKQPAVMELPSPQGTGEKARRESDVPLTALTGEIADNDVDLPDLSVISQNTDNAELPAHLGQKNGDPVERLRGLISDRKEETVEILRSWLEDREENA